MANAIEILNGISQGTRFWLEKRVVRIGSDPGADLCIPSAELPPIAATLEFREGDWTIHDRSGQGVTPSEAESGAQESVLWQSGKVIELCDRTQLRLCVYGEAGPAPQPSLASKFEALSGQGVRSPALETASRHGTAVARGSAAAKWGQYVVIAVCLLGCAGLILWQPGDNAPGKAAPNFQSLIEEAIGSKSTSQVLVQRLQYAQAAFGRGDRELAREWFRKLRDDLLRQEDRLIIDKKEIEIKILHFAEHQIGRLE